MKTKYFVTATVLFFIVVSAKAQQPYPEKPDLKWTPPANYYTIDPTVNNKAGLVVVEKEPEGPGSETKPVQPASTQAVKPVQKKVVANKKTKNN